MNTDVVLGRSGFYTLLGPAKKSLVRNHKHLNDPETEVVRRNM